MNGRKQDAYVARVLSDGTLCVIVADGAGSSAYGGQGASLVCRLIGQAIRAWCEGRRELPDDEQLRNWIDSVRDAMSVAAEKRESTRRQFAATVALLLVRDGRFMAAQIGDSAIVGRVEGGAWEVICWPDSGELASTTYFVTDDPEVRLHVVRAPLMHTAFAIFSDGIETIALQRAELRPYAGFFDPMIKPVDRSEGSGRLGGLSEALGRYLDGPAVCERTDDDKTLVLVSGA